MELSRAPAAEEGLQRGRRRPQLSCLRAAAAAARSGSAPLSRVLGGTDVAALAAPAQPGGAGHAGHNLLDELGSCSRNYC